jgi:hypothetical protein
VSRLSCWENIRILAVDFGSSIPFIDPEADILFPCLQYLHVLAFHEDIIRYITFRWQIPSLKTLSIRGTRSSAWGGLLENHRRLTKLEVLVLNNTNQLIIPQDITFTELQTLYFRAKCSETIHAPRLERYGLYGGSATDASEIAGSVRRAIGMFPTIKYVDISVQEFRNVSPFLQAVFMTEFEFILGTDIKLKVRTIE